MATARPFFQWIEIADFEADAKIPVILRLPFGNGTTLAP